MIIIDSSNYISDSFIYDFGKLPDAFLPIGNNRLLDIIIKRIHKKNEKIIVIIPDDFNLDKISNLQFSNLDLKYIKEKEFLEIRNIIFNKDFNLIENIKYLYSSALPLQKKSGFENFKNFSRTIPSFGINIHAKLKLNDLLNNKKICSIK